MREEKQNVPRRHTGYPKLKGALREKGYTYEQAARKVGISDTAMSQKLNGSSDFYIHEAKVLRDLTGYPLEELFQTRPEKMAAGGKGEPAWTE